MPSNGYGLTRGNDVTYHSYSGCDIMAVLSMPQDSRFDEFLRRHREYLQGQVDRYSSGTITSYGSAGTPEERLTFYQYQLRHLASSKILVLGNIQTLSYSVFREKFPVRALGRSGAKAYTRGTRTIAGSLIFTVFDKGALQDIMNVYYDVDGEAYSPFPERPVIADQVPPFNIIVLLTNEYGSISRLILSGVDLFNEGMVLSINDILTENTFEFMARHLEPMRSKMDIDAALADVGTWAPIPGLSLEWALKNDSSTQRFHESILRRAMDPYV